LGTVERCPAKRIYQTGRALLNVGYQQVLTPAVPGQTVRFRSDRDFGAQRTGKRVQYENLAGAACRRENESTVTLGAQHTAAFGTARHGSIQCQASAIDDLDGVIGRMCHEHTARVEMYVAVVEITRTMGWQHHVSAQGERHYQRPDN
jgi:hypothetical protein